MPQETDPAFIADVTDPLEDTRKSRPCDVDDIAASARAFAGRLIWIPGTKVSRYFEQRLSRLATPLAELIASIESERLKRTPQTQTEDERWLFDNPGLLRSVERELREATPRLSATPHARLNGTEAAPRVILIAEDLLRTLNCSLADDAFTTYVEHLQRSVVLNLDELSALASAVKLVLVEQIVAQGIAPAQRGMTAACLRSLLYLREIAWNDLTENLVAFEEFLRRDPAGAYARMDCESREFYRRTVQKFAGHSDRSEVEIAKLALALAQESLKQREPDARLALRRSHVGYYLIAEGREELCRRANIRLPLHERLERFLRRHPNEFYLGGIELVTIVIVIAILWRGIDFYSLKNAFAITLVLLLPCSQGAVEVLNYLTTSLLHPDILPKLDFHDGIPDDRLTVVAIPVLLLGREQARKLVHDLEVRYVGNLSPNLHFALLTDLPDSKEQPREEDPLVDYCAELIEELNRKYSGNGAGTFFLFHRHRIYNPREGVWMGWERKRGKLLDFNKLIVGAYDSFPCKVGDLAILKNVRYVLTLDVDTTLPRGEAHRLIGALSHPLCQAIVDPELNIVVEGYGILQPRVGVSVQSAAQSRLASIYSGQTGMDMYTRAVSDVYQDLYGEGTFTGKGLYEVQVLHRVLDNRFPRNSLLSHDLIEGAYTRAGLVTDVQVIDQYPSHYSAYSRRKHRWLRGDWQIAEWLLDRVPDESGHRVPNPTSIVSRWKILDNLRRSLVEPATFLLLLLSWTVLPHSPLYWTAITLAILFLPPWVQFAVRFLRAVLTFDLKGAAGAVASLASAMVTVLLSLTFLAHNALLAVDAIVRALYRRMISRERLLEWETAAEAEMKTRRRAPVDTYLEWTPIISGVIGLWIFAFRRPALIVALPVLVLWACSKLIAIWLDRPAHSTARKPSKKEDEFLRWNALSIWRFFAEHSSEEHHWLVPDSVQEEPARIGAQVSPTNLGMLLNARLAACELGYLTVPEFIDLTLRTFETMEHLQLYRGHLLNWYDTRTLRPLAPRFVSTADSGNLAAALVALRNGCAALLERPLVSPTLWNGCDDLIRALQKTGMVSRKGLRAYWGYRNLPVTERLSRSASFLSEDLAGGAISSESNWFAAEFRRRHNKIVGLFGSYVPWALPQFASLQNHAGTESIADLEHVPLADLPARIDIALAHIQIRIQIKDTYLTNATDEAARAGHELLTLLIEVRVRAASLIRKLRLIMSEAEKWFSRMDFGFLLNRRRRLLSIGYDVDTATLQPSCYDLLASESRIAAFLAIAKNDIPQKTWFHLGRAHVPTALCPVLISWTGTMFEYLMPALWMRSWPNTSLERSMAGAVREQQVFAAERRIRWGISESAFSQLDSNGMYQYGPFGVPQLALQENPLKRLVIAPYATALALAADSSGAIRNLWRMESAGWHGRYGFYEAVDFTPEAKSRSVRRRGQIVRSWMAHHQGMSLLAITNFLSGDVFCRWFHEDPRVESAELLLQEPAVLHASRALRVGRKVIRAARARSAEQEKLLMAS